LTREDGDDEEFLTQLANYTLDSWDHYTHLRIAFILLNQHGRREGMKLIFAGIKTFIENSPRTRRGGNPTEPNNRGTTFHETMTYFWVHMVHYAIESIKITAATTGVC
jgi:ADP-ribosylation factor protein 1